MDWILTGRVLKKTPVKQFRTKVNKIGEFFSITIMDSDRSEIRGSFFNTACHKYLEFIQEDRVYTFTRGQLKENTTASFKSKVDLNIIFDDLSTITQVDDSDFPPANPNGPGYHLKLKTIADVDKIVHGTILDFVGMVLIQGEIIEVVRKAGDLRSRRNVLLLDFSKKIIMLSVWGSHAAVDYQRHRLVLLKNVKVSVWF